MMTWFKSSYSSESANCVEVSFRDNGDVWMRDNKLGDDSPVLWFTVDGWRAFIELVRDTGASRPYSG